ncbi:hypothetical protein MRX96_041646 [Rhipicephalus microplus]
MPSPPARSTVFSCEEDPAAIVVVGRLPFYLCPVMLYKHVVGVYGQSRDSHFTIVSVYAPLHKPINWTLQAVQEGLRAGDERGAQVMEFTAAAGLVVTNDPQFKPTYEMAYAANWIDRTLAKPSVLMSGYVWIVRSDVTHSEHKNIAVRTGSDEAGARKRLT